MQVHLLKEEKAERDKAKKESNELIQLRESAARKMESRILHSREIFQLGNVETIPASPKHYDVFISHASEDKEEFSLGAKSIIWNK